MSVYLHTLVAVAVVLSVVAWLVAEFWVWAKADLKAEDDAKTDAMITRGMEVAELMEHPSWKWHRREPPRPKPTPRPKDAA